MPDINVECRPILSQTVRFKHDAVRNTDVLLAPEKVVKLNSTASAILGLCDGTNTVIEIVEQLEVRFKQTDIRDDVIEFLQDISSYGWIEIK